MGTQRTTQLPDSTFVFPNEDLLLSSRVDSTSTPGYTYFGSATPGSPVGSPVWRISRVSSTGEELWANGSTEFNQTWLPSNYTTLNYS